MEIPIVGGAYLGRSSNLNAQVCQNLYPITGGPGGKKIIALANTPGLTEYLDLGSGEIRAMDIMGDYLYVVMGNQVYKVDITPTATLMTGNLNSSTGKIWMRNNGTQIMIVDNPYGYILTGTTVALITDADFPIVSSLTYQDGYFIVTKKNTGRFYISDSYDGTSWNALNYATAEGDPDNLIGCISARRELWLFGSKSYEVWYNSGDATFPFERIQGSFNRVGCSAVNSIDEFEGTVAWLDNLKQVRISSGYGSQKISTEQIDYQIGQYTTISDAIGYFYVQEGHIFYVLTFPTEGKTWVYDFTTQLWHTRASGNTDLRHRANCYANFNNLHIIGDFENGKLYKYDLTKYSDNGTMLRRIRTAQAISVEKRDAFYHFLEIEFEAGVGLLVDDTDLDRGQDPEAILQWSDDGGHVWSNEHWVKMGKMGEYKRRAIWRRLGRSRDRIYKVIITDPVKVVILGAYLQADIGTS